MKFTEFIINRAKSNIKKIVLPESYCGRVLKATETVVEENFADIVLIGDRDKLQARLDELEFGLDLDKVEIINPETSELKEHLAGVLHSLREHKGMTIDEAYNTILDPIYFGTMLLQTGYVDGLVAGTVAKTADVLRPALQIIKAKEDVKLVSSFFLMEFENNEYVPDNVLIFSDAALVENPNSEELADIAIMSAKSYENFVLKEPRVALLSYSTKGSAHSDFTQKVIDAYNIVKDKNPNLKVDGELQADSAIVPDTASRKGLTGPIQGNANVLIFPDINSGNIAYKLVQRLAGAKAYGPMCQGFNKPVNDLSRGSTIDDVIGTIALTAVQAQENN